MVGFGSELNVPNNGHPSFEGWSSEEVEKYFSDLDDREIAEIVRERISGHDVVNESSMEELAAMFGIDLDSLVSFEEEPNKPSRPAGFALPTDD